MNMQDMTDAEVYERGIEILLDRLGSAGLVQFLRQCKPCTGDYTAERQKWINDDTTHIKTIVKRIQEKRKRVVAENVVPKSVEDMSDMEIYEFGLKAISLKLGPVGVVRFVHLFDADGYTHILERLEAKHDAWLDSGFKSEYPHLAQLAYSPKASTDEKRNTIQEIIDVYEEIKANY